MTFDPRFRIHALGLIGGGAIMSIMMTTPVISLYLNGRGLPAAQIGAIIGIMSAALVLAEVTLAVVVPSRIGRRATIGVALAGSAVMLGWFPFITSLAGLYLNRIGFGAIRGLLWPATFAEVADSSPPERRGAAFSMFWLYFGVGTLVGPAAGGLLGERFTLVAPFFAAAAISALTLGAIGAVRPDRDPAAARPLASYAVLLRTRTVPRNLALTVCNVVVFSIYATFLPLHAAARGLSPAQIGVIFTAGAVAFIIGQDTLRRLSSRMSGERLLVPAFLARGIGAAVVPLLDSFAGLLAANFLASLLTAAIPPALSIRVAAAAPRGHLVPAMGAFNAAADLGFFVGPVAGGILAGIGLQWAFWLAIPATAAALLLLRGSQTLGPRPEAQQPIQHHRGEQDAQVED
ncbi:MAG TPA: MFS transporter [bacterium]|nr:MFS transporter [bacterium]